MSVSEKSTALRSSKKRKRDNEPVKEIEVDITAPEPPSKKVQRKANKAKDKPTRDPFKSAVKSIAPTSDANSIQQPEELPKEKDAVESTQSKRSEHGIWIGNLPWIATKDHLVTFLTSNSDITEALITRVHMPIPKTNIMEAARQKVKPQNKGFAYIDFSDDTCVTTAISLSEKLLSGRRVLIKNARSFEGRPDPLKEKDGATEQTGKQLSKSPNQRVFVGNLAFDTTQEELQEQFAKCGEITQTFMATFQDTGKCKGYAWVEFQELEAAVAAVRGWVTVDDKSGESDSSEAEGEQVKGLNVKKRKKPKTTKWWVNRIRGRPLRMEFAEDKVTRYKKRFGKGGTAKKDDIFDSDLALSDDISKGINENTPGIVGHEKLTGQIVASRGKKTTF
ncbi:hypothetical protein MMC14_007379 [Varicellaria rhodocarpa]|nr:hypothetical protein [Varicellaria rhodocarpa]